LNAAHKVLLKHNF